MILFLDFNLNDLMKVVRSYLGQFWSKIEILVKNRNFLSEIEIAVKKKRWWRTENYGQIKWGQELWNLVKNEILVKHFVQKKTKYT